MNALAATFPLVPASLEAEHYVEIGNAGAVYQVLGVEHGPVAHGTVEGVDTFKLKVRGDGDYTRDTRIRLRPVLVHEVPWAAPVHKLPLGPPTV